MGENINWKKMIQNIVLEIDKSIRQKDDEIVSLSKISSISAILPLPFVPQAKNPLSGFII